MSSYASTPGYTPEPAQGAARIIHLLVKQEGGHLENFALPPSRIGSIEPVSDSKTNIVLMPQTAPKTWIDGTYSITIPVYLPYDRLVEKIYNSGPVVDLRGDCVPPSLRQRMGEYRVGDRVHDGAIAAGTSPDTGRQFFVAPQDEPRRLSFSAAFRRAARAQRETGQNWRVPTEGELRVLFNHRAYIGGFNTDGMVTEGVYWSSTRDGFGLARSRGFSNKYGRGYSDRKRARNCVRLVRD